MVLRLLARRNSTVVITAEGSYGRSSRLLRGAQPTSNDPDRAQRAGRSVRKAQGY